MSIFISYSHTDAQFVEKLALELFRSKAAVWLDRWELNVGDSLIQRVQDAIVRSGALVVVLSKASVESEWCKKELSAGLIRELEERKVLLLPLLLEDCSIPLFLREKKYADFRKDFTSGFHEIRDALARFSNDTQNRVEDTDGHLDWSIDWQQINGKTMMDLIVVEQSGRLPFSILSFIHFELNAIASARHEELTRHGFGSLARQLILEILADLPMMDHLYVLLEDSSPVLRQFSVGDPKIGTVIEVTAECRRMGVDTGKDIALDLGKQIRRFAVQSRESLTPEPGRKEELLRIMKKYRPDFPNL